ncbi:Rpn family recombination-promoting nuclease/putative transposase [uncultured Brachyspira sp.]|uniref:Rpn family recombination-promoting nuclease/putative transposase n=1 Tax=uncultured Brachyspira sp. TaxID=221953 RepID=UPI0026124C3E|nr:Rpn family recombination-promoting nuclease/putative transposase [uncultured Brachyspira sp.]
MTMDNFLMKPKIDFAFKEIMANEKARIGFLSAVLKIRPEGIKETRILNTYLQKVHEDDKQGILDVRILMNNDTEIDTEIQLSELKVWADRALFYLSKMYTEQIKQGQSYDVFKKCVNISILNFTLFPKETEFYSCFHIREDTRNFLYTDKMEFHVIELPKLPEEIKENSSDIELWARFINAERKEELEMIATKNPYIESAYQQLQVISQDKEKRLEYEAREKAIRDYNQAMKEAKETGWETGREVGREEGEKIGENRVNKLHSLLLQNKRYDDLERSTKDYEFQKQLMREYGIL